MKILMYLLILGSMGCGTIKEFSYSGLFRNSWQKTKKVLKVLDLKPGQNIADIGAGGGYFSMRFSEMVGESGRVFAVEVDKDMIEILKSKVQKKSRKNISVIKGKPDDSMLPNNKMDLIFICNVYHHMSHRIPYFKKLKKKLRPGGRLAIIELKPQGILGLWGAHGTDKKIIEKDMNKAGYNLQARYDFLKYQNFQIFKVISAD